ncbi:SDR family NAD(P)-dependent oxidoreductase [Ferrimonas marina]|uniref:Short-chain dehydrogenase n=1 Tax=Ferrimonas marina TaxID=299255 RepID=A0A1M5X2S6_9GAMM|nr:SDR family NAD(P)-dependent oxidoreductase [Ferrimonas marina]SHH94135.1 Short-chain dehydrogenase [Ferrimonas marina]
MQWQQQVAVVTGANRGLGRALTQALLGRGVAKVYACSRRGICDDDPRLIPVTLDITCEQQIMALTERAQDATLLINNAGINGFGDALGAPMASIQAEMETNAFGTLRLIRALVPDLRHKPDATIVNVISVCALAGMPGLAGYSASKAALFSLHQSLIPLLQEQGIQLLGAFPGPIDTEMNAGQAVAEMATAESVAQAILTGIAQRQAMIFPDSIGKEVQAQWQADPLALAGQFRQYR